MPTDEWLARPLSEFVRSVAFSVAEGQEELDRRSMAAQRALEREIESGELAYDLDASWLRFSEVEADLELTLSVEGKEIRDPETNEVRGYKPVVSAVPLNHRVVGEYEVDAEIASEVRLKIAPVPPESRRP
ncbi:MULTISPECIES: hypothetical protein [unclassified Halorubrum]|uniref:hypothetical protein n=1 Tax=unclassified Halorubrum TaxID=2642239 RepID=UPI000B981405|nr:MULTISPECIES: hypothetical protein [unclassified Halorubrum]OYR47468.1 hypothetical protein DJ74_12605 [Halorubrum sp. Ea8]OYR48073.1 hypothetical protein DJ75_03235 [Halorubrum sp. Eb13]